MLSMAALAPESLLPRPAKGLASLPTYVFAELDRLKIEAKAKFDALNMPMIDLGIGSPDAQTPQPIVDAIARAAQDPANHRYPNFKGKPEFRQAIVSWMQRRYGVSLDVETEVLPLIGAKEGLAHLTLAYVEPGTISLVPSPYYPVHGRATWIAGGQPYALPLTLDNHFLPDLDAVPSDILKQSKLLFLNFPHNPTAAVADLPFYEKAVAFCKQHGLLLVSDLAYADIGFDGYKPPSVLQVAGAKDIAIEFHSFSKSFNMAGWRLGYVVGNAEVIANLYAIKTNMDYGVCNTIQDGGTYALNHAESLIPPQVAMYQARRDIAMAGFQKLGWQTPSPKASMYLWLPIPVWAKDSWDFVKTLLDQTGVIVSPGSAFGEAGEGYFRISLVANEPVLQSVLARMENAGIRFDCFQGGC
ncbi:MAG: aminotransferase class I/II-fold pyridoxal phosphate-dependent enzyme [Vampirovibrionales bacterium]|nr:aminotransferase class I/II-fold pyridoxal phosphate-dependent enzyme [Vampirovibrionales bacterium]